MTRTAAFLLACLLAALAPATGPDDAHAAGPWRGQVVDAETGQPIEGVVVVAVWERLSPGVIHQARAFHDVDEVVTDAEGRFVLPERELSPPNPFITIDGPQLTMFKGGYGLWQFRGAPPMSGPGGIECGPAPQPGGHGRVRADRRDLRTAAVQDYVKNG